MADIGCYIIHSSKLGRFYVGVCQDDLSMRIQKNNSGFYGKSKYTSTTSDWELKLFIPTLTYAHALWVEKKIKSMKSSKYIENLLRYPELVSKIIEQAKST